MGKPLTGSITANPCGTFTASVPKATGSSKRKNATFKTRIDAQVWVRDCIVALKAGQPLPPAGRGSTPSRTLSVATGTAFETVGTEFVRERYLEDGHGDVEREKQVRGYIKVIDDYMRHRHLTIESLTRKDARTMFRHLLRTDSDAAMPFPVELDPETLVTKQKARALLETHGHPASDSTFKRALRRGLLAPADITGRAHLFRLGDFIDPATGLATAGGVAEGHDDATSRGRYSHSTLVQVRALLWAVLDYAESEDIVLQPKVRAAKLPKNKKPKTKTRALTLSETAVIAGRLHVVHQLVLWLLRLLGLRISEAYGLLVEDVIDQGPGLPGLLIVQSQGGKKFHRRGADGSTCTIDRVDEVKSNSARVLVVPDVVMVMIRVVIAVFHTDRDSVVRTDACLVPGLKRADAGGQSAFRQALKFAAAAEGLDLRFDDPIVILRLPTPSIPSDSADGHVRTWQERAKVPCIKEVIVAERS